LGATRFRYPFLRPMPAPLGARRGAAANAFDGVC